jgi:hypothetical protein
MHVYTHFISVYFLSILYKTHILQIASNILHPIPTFRKLVPRNHFLVISIPPRLKILFFFCKLGTPAPA